MPRKTNPSASSTHNCRAASQLSNTSDWFALFEHYLHTPANVVVASYKDIEAMLEMEKQKDLLGCDDVACMTELGGAVGADYAMNGELAQVAEEYLLSIRIVDTRDSIARSKSLVEFRDKGWV